MDLLSPSLHRGEEGAQGPLWMKGSENRLLRQTWSEAESRVAAKRTLRPTHGTSPRPFGGRLWRLSIGLLNRYHPGSITWIRGECHPSKTAERKISVSFLIFGFAFNLRARQRDTEHLKSGLEAVQPLSNEQDTIILKVQSFALSSF